MARKVLRTSPPPRSSAVVVAAGSSSRMGGKVRKPYLKLRGKPILVWTLAALGKVEGLTQIVLVTRPEDRAMARDMARRAKLRRGIKVSFADGGARRQDSVFSGLSKTSVASKLVLIHDAARPFPPQAAMRAACDQALEIGAAILAVRVKDTVKKEAQLAPPGRGPANDAPQQLSSRIETTVPRAGLWLAQTPQIFQRGLILELFEKLAAGNPNQEVTDDASICELFHAPVALVESSETNLKVTRPEDLLIAEAYLKAKMV